jgi:hypothetical protein
MRIGRRRRHHSLDAMDVATRFVNAANQHDPDTLVACAHRQFESIQPAHPGRNFRGVGQLRSNWEAIFRTEPGFRLTVLRSHASDDTVWMELHGAGEEAEAAGTFIMGIEDGRIRWIRVYSDIVEHMPNGTDKPGAPGLTAVPPLPDGEAVTSNGSVTAPGDGDGDGHHEQVEGPIADAEAVIGGAGLAEDDGDSRGDDDDQPGDLGGDSAGADEPRRRRGLFRRKSKSG